VKSLALAQAINKIWLECLLKHGINPPADCTPSDDEMADLIDRFEHNTKQG
jgi:hypothetical protein